MSGVSDQAARRGALEAATRWRLPFSRRAWRGPAGNWVGAGIGSSLDFQDHRNYVPGDDPRHIHWQAYARTGALTMKLYRAEVAPFVDLVVDFSASMTLTAEKALRTDELVAFCVECADRAAAPVRIHAVLGRGLRAIMPDDVRAGRWRAAAQRAFEGGRAAAAGAGRDPVTEGSAVPGPFSWRPGALKVLISDLLFPGDPSKFVLPLAGAGVGVILAPAAADEAELPWRGNIELTDCETGAVRRQRVDEALAQRYRAAYARHFALWQEASRRRDVFMARIPSGAALAMTLGGEAFVAGAVEAVG